MPARDAGEPTRVRGQCQPGTSGGHVVSRFAVRALSRQRVRPHVHRSPPTRPPASPNPEPPFPRPPAYAAVLAVKGLRFAPMNAQKTRALDRSGRPHPSPYMRERGRMKTQHPARAAAQSLPLVALAVEVCLPRATLFGRVSFPLCPIMRGSWKTKTGSASDSTRESTFAAVRTTEKMMANALPRLSV